MVEVEEDHQFQKDIKGSYNQSVCPTGAHIPTPKSKSVAMIIKDYHKQNALEFDEDSLFSIVFGGKPKGKK